MCLTKKIKFLVDNKDKIVYTPLILKHLHKVNKKSNLFIKNTQISIKKLLIPIV